ncbi:hypothetical protein FPL06_06485 [Xanthomonas citri pv. glycines]|nr:hypothetical protein BHE84_24650 [Xanthomonas citri pv. glycines str. 8ra]QDR46604.1 hypothetical protein FPK90_19715 [Xanthomonas citri pv. glycines]QDS08596.1 hypothetical protein FPL00_18605 [Xanthomonas citri pv. glycines]QDS12942.1 hypothetical protein FPL03_18965 [Xanthomonas citri pv. glycines]QDS21591.1 hypothetical protein FPL05_19340 [Xanthomonas citri pv. glycines]
MIESPRRLDAGKGLVCQVRGALTASGTRRKSVGGGSVAAWMPPTLVVWNKVRTSRTASAPHRAGRRRSTGFDRRCWRSTCGRTGCAH